MANRAYLYSSDQPDDWERPTDQYYDSRWTIPLAWFFFYRADHIRIVNVNYHGSRWQEVKFSAEKQTALALFGSRRRLLTSLVGEKISPEILAEFVGIVENRAGEFLLLNPYEVLGGMSEDDLFHAEQFSRIVKLLGSDDSSLELVREALRPYFGVLSSDPDKCKCQVIGCTY